MTALPAPQPTPPLLHRLGLLALSQVVWFAAVLGAAAGRPWLGPVAVGVFLVLHVATTADRRRELQMALFAAALGYTLDSTAVLLGALDFPEPARLGGPSTLWMVSLWIGFAATLRTAARGLVDRPLVGALFGLIGGPMAYWAGVRFGAAEFGEPVLRSVLIVSVEWVLAMSALGWWARRG